MRATAFQFSPDFASLHPGYASWKLADYASLIRALDYELAKSLWPAPGSEDTELGVLMEPEVGHGEAEVYTRVQA